MLDPRPKGSTAKASPKGTSCWIELANQPGCYVWNSYFQQDETVAWTAGCAEGLAHGTGTLTEVWDGGKKTEEKTGRIVEGKALGRWVYRDQDGNVSKGSYEEGMRHGDWVERLAGGTVQEGPYEAGKRQGKWVLRFASGTVMEGSFVKGYQEGSWVLRFASGNVSEGPYKAGKRHGHWVERLANPGPSRKAHMRRGNGRDKWILRFAFRDRDGRPVRGGAASGSLGRALRGWGCLGRLV